MNIATFQSKLDFINELYSNEEWTDRECREDILAALEEAHTNIVNAFGECFEWMDVTVGPRRRGAGGGGEGAAHRRFNQRRAARCRGHSYGVSIDR